MLKILPSASTHMRKRWWNRSTTLSIIACGCSSHHWNNLAFSSSLSIQQCLITALSSSVNGMKMSLDYLKARVPVLWELEDWFWNNPDLNPMYYWVRDDLEARVCRHPIDTMEELKARIVKFWEEFPQAIINKVIDRFHRRLRICIEAEGKLFEHLM